MVRRAVRLVADDVAAQLLQRHLTLAVADHHTVHGDLRAGGDALDGLLLAVHRAFDAIVIAFTEQVDAVVSGAAPNGVLGARIHPHRLLGEVEAGLVDVAQHADGRAGLAVELLVSDHVGAAGEHDGRQQHAEHDGDEHEEHPRQHRPTEYDAEDDEHDHGHEERAGDQRRKHLVFLVRVLEDRYDLFDRALLLGLRLLGLLVLACHQLPRLV